MLLRKRCRRDSGRRRRTRNSWARAWQSGSGKLSMASVRLAALGDCGVTGRAEGRRGPVLDGGGGESRLPRLPVGSGGPSRSCIRPRGAAVVLPPPAPRDADRSELHQEHHHADDCRQDRGDINEAHLLLPLLRLSRGRSPAAARRRGRRGRRRRRPQGARRSEAHGAPDEIRVAAEARHRGVPPPAGARRTTTRAVRRRPSSCPIAPRLAASHQSLSRAPILLPPEIIGQLLPCRPGADSRTAPWGVRRATASHVLAPAGHRGEHGGRSSSTRAAGAVATDGA